MTNRARILGLVGFMFLAAVAIPAAQAQQTVPSPDHMLEQFGPRPAVPDAALSEEVQAALGEVIADVLDQSAWDPNDRAALEALEGTKDPRIAWILSDMMRFTWSRAPDDALAASAAALLGVTYETPYRWSEITDHLIAWDIPAYPGYLADKRALFTRFLPGLEPLMVEGDIDWHLVTWGGVRIDNRPYDRTDETCPCIPAADNPEVSTAAEATWLKDDDIVFGIGINGEYRAYPRRIMEVREMVNDTLGGRDLGIPYCTLCGAAQAYFTDRLPEGVERPVLRTSGLLIRSNKVMYDITSMSVFDTFLGKAVTGPLAAAGVQLEQAAVITSDWGSWKAAHPETTVLVEALALGRDFDFRNTRDANGPIFPVGDVDPRLPVHEDVIGVITGMGTPVAFQRSKAVAALSRGEQITFEDVRLEMDGGGVRATKTDGSDLGSHQAFWFAWSQFHPATALWPPR